jgi:hypothetical protein
MLGANAMKRRILAWIVLLLALPAVVHAQTSTIERQVKGTSNANINAGIFASIRRDCTAGPLPVVRLLSPPAHGKVTVKQGRLRATNMKQCLGMELPAFVAIYRSVPDFIGQDNFTIELIGVGGKAQIQQITVTVMRAGSGQGI